MQTTFQIDPYKVAVYIRWSTDDQEKGTTLEVQMESCSKFVESQGWVFREDLLVVDDGYSGGNMDRPALAKLRQMVQAGHVQCVVVFKIDRLSRSVIDTVNLVLDEWEGKCYVKSTREPIDTTNAMGKQFFYMLVSYAEWERSVIRERTYGGKLKRASQGRNAGQKYPFGYRRADGPDGGWALDGWDPAAGTFIGKAAVVRRLFDLFLTGMSMPAIAGLLNKEGIRCPEGGKQWRFNYIGRIMDNPIYCGRYEYGRTRGREEPLFSVSDCIPPIVTVEEWEKIRQMRKAKAEMYSKAAPGQYLLSGLAVCRNCGAKIAGSKGATKRYYVCVGKTILKQCDCAFMDKEVLERKVIEEVRSVISVDSLEFQMSRIGAEIERQQGEALRNWQAVQQEVTAVERKKERLEDQFLTGELDAKLYLDLAKKVERDMSAVLDRLRRAELAHAQAQQTSVDPAYLQKIAQQVQIWEELTFEELRQLLSELVADLKIYQQKFRPGMKNMVNPNPIYLEWIPRLK